MSNAVFKQLKVRWGAGAALAGVAVALLAGVMALSPLTQWRIDLTEDQLYTLSPGTRNILANLEEPVTLQFYYSETLSREIPALRNYAQRVEEMLREYERAANGKLVLQVIHPEVFSEEEDAAAAGGLRALPNGQGDSVYLGLVGLRGEQQERVAFFNPQREHLLEYEISQLVYRLSRPKPLVAGVLSGVPVFRSMDFRTNTVRPAWMVTEQWMQLFDIRREMNPDIEKIDDDLNLLIVIHPRLLPERTLYAIDQFVLRGGRLLVFVDPVAETDESERTFGTGFTDRSSTLDKLFTAWGIEYHPDKVLLDLTYAHDIPVSQYGRPVPHVGILGLHGSAIQRDQHIIAELDNINVASAGALAPAAGAGTQFIPLLSSSEQSMLMEASQYAMLGDHSELLRQFKPDNQRRHLAALVTGDVKTAFPEGKPAPAADPAKPAAPPATPSAEATAAPLQASREPIHVIVVADTDILSDRMWVDVSDFYGQRMASPFAANGDMTVNFVDALGGSADLITLRSRGTYQRPFTRVDALEKAASERLRAEQDALVAALADTEKKLTALNQPAAPAEGETAQPAPLSPEQQAEVDKFQAEKLRIRKNLRDVQRQLNQDVEQLAFTLKVANMVAVPVLLTLLALLVSAWRARHARRPV